MAGAPGPPRSAVTSHKASKGPACLQVAHSTHARTTTTKSRLRHPDHPSRARIASSCADCAVRMTWSARFCKAGEQGNKGTACTRAGRTGLWLAVAVFGETRSCISDHCSRVRRGLRFRLPLRAQPHASASQKTTEPSRMPPTFFCARAPDKPRPRMGKSGPRTSQRATRNDAEQLWLAVLPFSAVRGWCPSRSVRWQSS